MTGLPGPGVLGEGASLLAALYGGLAIGLAYDLFRLLRLPFENPWIIGLIDGLYYIAAGGVAAGTMLYINCGTVRMYVFLAMGLGIYLYARFPGRLVRAALGQGGEKKQLRK